MEKFRRAGQGHPKAALTDHEVEAVRRAHEEGMTYALLAEKFEVSKSCVAGICKFRRRNCTPGMWP